MKIYRIDSGKKVGGICAGIADMFAFDVTLVRLVLIFATIFTGIWPGVITYLAGWYLIPEKEASGSVAKKEDQNSGE